MGNCFCYDGRSSLTNEKGHHYFLIGSYVLVSFLMTDYANSSSELSVASKASQYHGISWWPIGIGITFSAFSFSFTDSLFS